MSKPERGLSKIKKIMELEGVDLTVIDDSIVQKLSNIDEPERGEVSKIYLNNLQEIKQLLESRLEAQKESKERLLKRLSILQEPAEVDDESEIAIHHGQYFRDQFEKALKITNAFIAGASKPFPL